MYFFIILSLLIVIAYFGAGQFESTDKCNKCSSKIEGFRCKKKHMRTSFSKRSMRKSQQIDLDEDDEVEEVKLRNSGYKHLKKNRVKKNLREKIEQDYGYKHVKPGQKVYNQYGYSYMPPESWSVPQERPPVCIPQKGYESTVQPLPTTGTPIEALEYNEVMPKFRYEEEYDPKYYYHGWRSG